MEIKAFIIAGNAGIVLGLLSYPVALIPTCVKKGTQTKALVCQTVAVYSEFISFRYARSCYIS